MQHACTCNSTHLIRICAFWQYLARLHTCISKAFTCKHLHACHCMCAACEQISSERLHAYGLQTLGLYFILLCLLNIYIKEKYIHTTKRGNHKQSICSSHFATQWCALQIPSSFIQKILFHFLLLLLEHFLSNDTSAVMIVSSICLVTDKPQHMYSVVSVT